MIASNEHLLVGSMKRETLNLAKQKLCCEGRGTFETETYWISIRFIKVTVMIAGRFELRADSGACQIFWWMVSPLSNARKHWKMQKNPYLGFANNILWCRQLIKYKNIVGVFSLSSERELDLGKSWLSFIRNTISFGVESLCDIQSSNDLCLFLLVEKCMSSMQTGTQMVKLRGGSKGLVRFFYLDEHKSCIRWRPSRKNEKAKSKCHS